MILIDIHEDGLIGHFKPYDVPVENQLLPFGDIMFAGNGPSGPIMVGFERKRISDLVTSIRSKRLAGHQLEGMLDAYPDAPGLIVEGIWKAGHGGELVVRGGKDWVPLRLGSQPISYREVDSFLATMEEAGLRVYRTGGMDETAAFVVSRYKWWNDKEYREHKAHRGIYAPVPDREPVNGHRARFLKPETPSLVVKIAAQIPGIEHRAWKVGQSFKTPKEMIMATEDQWRLALGFKKGEATVKKIVGCLQ